MLRAWGWYKIRGEHDGKRPAPWRPEWRFFYWLQVKDGKPFRLCATNVSKFGAPNTNYHSYACPSALRESCQSWNEPDLMQLVRGPIIWPRIISSYNYFVNGVARLKEKLNAWLDDDEFTKLKRWTRVYTDLQRYEQRRQIKLAVVGQTIEPKRKSLPFFDHPNKPIWYESKSGKLFLIEPEKKDKDGRVLAWFVLLGGPKLADKTFKTIAEAMQAAEGS